VKNAPPSVECYSGHAYAERPVAFDWGGRRYQVERVLKQWRSPRGPGFRVLTAGGALFELTYDEIQDQWSLQEDLGRLALTEK